MEKCLPSKTFLRFPSKTYTFTEHEEEAEAGRAHKREGNLEQTFLLSSSSLFHLFNNKTKRRRRRPRIRNIKCLCTRYGRNIKVKCYFQTLNTLCKQYMAAANTKMRLPVVQKDEEEKFKAINMDNFSHSF